jgi:hypothetical protein
LLLTAVATRAEEVCLKNAWSALNRSAYGDAISAADECIENFGRAAERAEARLVQQGVPEPPTGDVSDAEKSRIFKQGLLNDVATAYFVKGQAAQTLARRGARSGPYQQMAKEAFEACCRFKHARTWDPRGWFWSPCEAAQDRLAPR